MPINLENFSTIRWQRLPAEQISEQLSVLATLVDKDSGEKDANINSQIKLLEIEQYITKGHDLFYKQQYQNAIENYNTAQGLIYQTLKPSFPINVTRRQEIDYPLDANLMNSLLASSLKYVEAMTPRTVEPDFALASIDVQLPVNEKLAQLEELGVNMSIDIPRAVRYDSQLAATYADQGQWEQAQYFYKSAQKALGDSQTPDGITAKAALALNLGGVLIQLGKPQEAVPLLKQALESFKKNNDLVGQAQANLNLAAGFTKSNQKSEAAESLKLAKSLLDLSAVAANTPAVGGTLPNTGPTGTVAVPVLPTNGSNSNVSSARIALSDTMTVKRNAIGTSAQVVSGLRLVDAFSKAGSLKTSVLTQAAEKEGQVVTFRQLEKGSGWTTQALQSNAEIEQGKYLKELGILTGDQLLKVQWQANASIQATRIIDKVYSARTKGASLNISVWPYYLATDFAVQLPHIYYYIIPVCLGDCYFELGEFAKAETYYFKAANYQYINQVIEAPALWQKIAKNTLEWGNAIYRNDNFQEAVQIYRKVMEPPGAATVINITAPLYTMVQLKATGTTVKLMLENYTTSGAGTLNPALAIIVLEIRARLIQLNASLDFLGMQVNLIPIWSFEYLQNIARYFAQQAISAERDYINFWDRGENEALSRQQLEQTSVLASAEKELAKQQREAAQAEMQVYLAGKALASTRRANAQANITDYSAMSAERISLSFNNAWYSSQNPWELGKTIPGSGPDAGKHIHQVVAENTARLQTITRNYELAAMGRQVTELQQGEVMAQAQVSAAAARVEAAQQMEVVSGLKAQFARETLNSFNNQLFTPEVWKQLGNFMRGICQSYLNMSIRVARMMQRAYNFENDLSRNFIKTNYILNPGLGKLAGDALLLDINNFTYDEITTIQRKQIPIRQTISLSSRYPFLFQTKFRSTGKLDFETRLEDFDLLFPGTYSQRIESMEVEIEGILPTGGVKGTLTNSGISWYRTANIADIKCRVQNRETLVLSEYRIREDAIIFPSDQRLLKVFEGAGTASSWVLEIPKATNDLDFNTITDVKLHFNYKARFDEQLATQVKTQLATFTNINSRSRSFPLRWLFPDSFFHFQDTGQLTFSLNQLDFPLNETNPQIKSLSMLVVMKTGVSPAAINLRLGVPAHPATELAVPNALGEISVPAGHAWIALEAGTAIGNYLFEIRANENPGLVSAGKLQLDNVANIVLIVDYDFTPRV